MSHVQFTVLGRVGVQVDGVDLSVPGRRERAVLAALLAAHGAVVPAERLVHQLWGPDAGDGALASLQVAVSRLRRLLEPSRSPHEPPQLLVSLGSGYALLAPPDDIDVDRFLAAVRAAQAALEAGDTEAALAGTRAAAELWGGDPFADVAEVEGVRAEVARLEEAHAWSRELRAEALMALGRHAEATGDLEALEIEQPLRERAAQLHALALYRGGRQADALAVLRRSREVLRDELGVEPAPASRELETAVLRQDPSLDPPALGAVPVADGPATTERVHAGARPERPPSVQRTGETDRSGGGSTGDPGAPLVGRDADFGRLRALVSDALEDLTGFALVEGPPGIGKTRLLEEVARYAGRRGALTVWGRCSEPGTAPAYWPWIEVLRGLDDAGLCPDPPAELGPLLSLDVTGAAGPAREQLRFGLFQAMTDVLHRAAARRALVILLEDLHWADPASAELLAHLAVRLHGAPVAVVGSLRELELGRHDAVVTATSAIARRSGLRLVLSGIPATAGPALVRSAVGHDVPVAVAVAIHRRAEGNPFGIGELSRLLARDGRLADPTDVVRVEVPAGVRDVVRDRLAALPAATRALLGVAAVVGRSADLPVLVHAAARSTDEVLGDLEPALTSRILVPVAGSPGRHRFAHALVREAALADLSSLHAARLHARVADALEAVGDRKDAAEVIAEHLWAAVPLVGEGRAARALETAAAEAVARTAYESAELHLSRALALRQAGDGSVENGTAELATAVRLLSLRVARHGFGPAGATSELPRAQELARRSGRLDLYLALLTIHWGALCTTGQVAAAHRFAAEMRELGGSSADPVLAAMAWGAWSVQQWHEGRVTEAAEGSAQVLRIIGELSAADLGRLDELGGGLTRPFAVYLADLGRSPESPGADADPDAAFETLAAAATDPYSTVVTANFGAFAAACADDPARTLRWSTRGLAEEGPRGFSFFGAAAQIYHGWAVARLSDPGTGLAELETGMRRYRSTGALTCWGVVLGMVADAMLLAGRPPEDAARVVADGRAAVLATGEAFALPYIDLADARIAAAAGEPRAVVVAHLDRATQGARRMGVRHVAAIAAALRGELGRTHPVERRGG